MTPQHIFYIPTLLLLGFVFGLLFGDIRKSKTNATADGFSAVQPSASKLFYAFFIFLLVFITTHFYEVPFGSKQISRLLDGQEIFDKKPLFTSQAVYAKIASFPEFGIEAYKVFTYTIDIIFPISFFFFLLTLAQFIVRRVKIPKLLQTSILILPVLWIASDIIENVIIYSLLSSYPNRLDVLAGMLGYVSSVKFGLLFLSIIAPLASYIFSKLNYSASQA